MTRRFQAISSVDYSFVRHRRDSRFLKDSLRGLYRLWSHLRLWIYYSYSLPYEMQQDEMESSQPRSWKIDQGSVSDRGEVLMQVTYDNPAFGLDLERDVFCYIELRRDMPVVGDMVKSVA